MNKEISAQFRASIASLQIRIEVKTQAIEWFTEHVRALRRNVRQHEGNEELKGRVELWKNGIKLYTDKTLPELRAELAQLQMAVDRAQNHFQDACMNPETAFDLLAEVAL